MAAVRTIAICTEQSKRRSGTREAQVRRERRAIGTHGKLLFSRSIACRVHLVQYRNIQIVFNYGCRSWNSVVSLRIGDARWTVELRVGLTRVPVSRIATSGEQEHRLYE